VKTLADIALGDDELGHEIRREVDRIVSSLPDDASCLLTGSIIEGLGNRNSDIDVYVVHGSGALANPVALGMRQSRYVDCEYMTLGSLDQLADRVSGDTGWAALLELPLSSVDRFYRVSVAVPARVAQGAEATLKRFDRQLACRTTRNWALVNAHQLLARGALLLASGDSHAAALHLRQAALWSCTSALGDVGEGYASAKWAGEKAARHYRRDSARHRELTDDFLRPHGTPAELLARVRASVTLPEELDALLSARSCVLAEQVRHVPGTGSDHLVRGRSSVAEVGGAVADVCRELAAGSTWAQATSRTAARWDVPVTEFRTALWHRTAPLRSTGFLLTD